MTANAFFERARAGELNAIRCTACGAMAVPPKEFCPSCGKRGWDTVPLSGDGTIASFTVIRVAPRNFTADAPYAIAQVRLKEGVALLGRVVDIPLEKVAIGLPVRFRPLESLGRPCIGFGPA